jgi:hypothetical protein
MGPPFNLSMISVRAVVEPEGSADPNSRRFNGIDSSAACFRIDG